MTAATVVLVVPQSLPGGFIAYFAAVDRDGRQGLLATQSVEAIIVGSGDVQVSVSWNVDSDLDLHVLDPNGEEIYYQATTSSSGGELDLDSNPGCDIDSIRNENITWPTGEAPSGTYTVRVDLWDSCGFERTDYVVTVIVGGQPPQTYTGRITGPGDEGSLGSGELVTTFEVG